jgi:hypothetical protein
MVKKINQLFERKNNIKSYDRGSVVSFSVLIKQLFFARTVNNCIKAAILTSKLNLRKTQKFFLFYLVS